MFAHQGAAAWVHRNGPVRLTARMRLQSSSEVSSIGLKTAMPALLTSASIRPKRAVHHASAVRDGLASETSQCSASVLSGFARPATARAAIRPRCRAARPASPRQESVGRRKSDARAAPVTRANFWGRGHGRVRSGEIFRSYNPSPGPCPGECSDQASRAVRHRTGKMGR